MFLGKKLKTFAEAERVFPFSQLFQQMKGDWKRMGKSNWGEKHLIGTRSDDRKNSIFSGDTRVYSGVD